MTEYILDSGFLYASIDTSDAHHPVVVEAANRIRGKIFLPAPAIVETAYFVAKNLGLQKHVDFIESLSLTEFDLLSAGAEDFVRSAEILRKYSDTNIDFVDACIVAMAERLNITKILTVDRRHFSVFRPRHCDAFEILP